MGVGWYMSYSPLTLFTSAIGEQCSYQDRDAIWNISFLNEPQSKYLLRYTFPGQLLWLKEIWREGFKGRRRTPVSNLITGPLNSTKALLNYLHLERLIKFLLGSFISRSAPITFKQRVIWVVCVKLRFYVCFLAWKTGPSIWRRTVSLIGWDQMHVPVACYHGYHHP